MIEFASVFYITLGTIKNKGLWRIKEIIAIVDFWSVLNFKGTGITVNLNSHAISKYPH